MKFVKGVSGNPAGRPVGKKGKVPQAFRAWLFNLINDNRDTIQADFLSLDPRERLAFIAKILPFVLPKQVTADEIRGACYTKNDYTVQADVFGEVDYKLKPWQEDSDRNQ